MIIMQRPMTPKRFRELLDIYPRLALSGVVQSGKTLLTPVATDRRVVHTDDIREMGVRFIDVPAKAIEMLEGEEKFLVAGVQVPRALRKGLKVDALVWLDQPLSALLPAQEAFGRGVRGIMHQWRNKNPRIPVYFCSRAAHDNPSERMPV